MVTQPIPACSSRRARERQQHRREILAAAERLFSEKGYRAATIYEIAREAQFAVGTIYTMFKDKDDLYASVLKGLAAELVSALERHALVLDDPLEALAAVIDTRLQHYRQHLRFYRRTAEAAPLVHPDSLACGAPELTELRNRYFGGLVALMDRGISRGAFVQADALHMALCFDGALDALVAHASRSGKLSPTSSESIVRELSKFIVRMAAHSSCKQHSHDLGGGCAALAPPVSAGPREGS